jgi:uncharacterized membrane protein
LSIRNPAILSGVLVIAAGLWMASILIAPYGWHLPYIIGSYICHQRPERSFWIAGAPMPVCARCTGLYASAALGAIVAARHAARDARIHSMAATRVRTLFFAAAVPTIVTLAVEWVGIGHPSTIVRALAALPLGATAGWIVTNAIRHAEVD